MTSQYKVNLFTVQISRSKVSYFTLWSELVHSSDFTL